jgi:hypothetical protein
MEPVSLTLAVAGIPGIFVACVDCFRYIQLGREFETDFEVALCKLEAAEMRLTRWGQAMGISGPDTKLRTEDYNEEDLVKAFHWLSEIQRAFESAREMSSRYQTTTTRTDRLKILDTDVALKEGSGPLRSLHNRMRRVNDSRIKVRTRDRISWALYRKGNFESLLENVSELINNLVELFPSAAQSQADLCREEVHDLDAGSLVLLDKTAGDDDELLRQILRAEVENRPNLFSKIEVRERFRGHFGDNVAAGEKSRSGIYSHIQAGGEAIAHFGNNIGDIRGIETPR